MGMKCLFCMLQGTSPSFSELTAPFNSVEAYLRSAHLSPPPAVEQIEWCDSSTDPLAHRDCFGLNVRFHSLFCDLET